MQNQIVFQGLNTDSTPDTLDKGQAFDLKNVVPVSPQSLRPRFGSSLVAHYKSTNLGRSIIVDGLKNDLSAGISVICVNTTDAGASDGTLAHQVDGVFAFRPRRIADAYDAVDGFALHQSIVAVVK